MNPSEVCDSCSLLGNDVILLTMSLDTPNFHVREVLNVNSGGITVLESRVHKRFHASLTTHTCCTSRRLVHWTQTHWWQVTKLKTYHQWCVQMCYKHCTSDRSTAYWTDDDDAPPSPCVRATWQHDIAYSSKALCGCKRRMPCSSRTRFKLDWSDEKVWRPTVMISPSGAQGSSRNDTSAQRKRSDVDSEDLTVCGLVSPWETMLPRTEAFETIGIQHPRDLSSRKPVISSRLNERWSNTRRQLRQLSDLHQDLRYLTDLCTLRLDVGFQSPKVCTMDGRWRCRPLLRKSGNLVQALWIWWRRQNWSIIPVPSHWMHGWHSTKAPSSISLPMMTKISNLGLENLVVLLCILRHTCIAQRTHIRIVSNMTKFIQIRADVNVVKHNSQIRGNVSSVDRTSTGQHFLVTEAFDVEDNYVILEVRYSSSNQFP